MRLHPDLLTSRDFTADLLNRWAPLTDPYDQRMHAVFQQTWGNFSAHPLALSGGRCEAVLLLNNRAQSANRPKFTEKGLPSYQEKQKAGPDCLGSAVDAHSTSQIRHQAGRRYVHTKEKWKKECVPTNAQPSGKERHSFIYLKRSLVLWKTLIKLQQHWF